MKSSASSGLRIVQSASLPGSDELSSALLRRVSSRALRAAWRARAAEIAFRTIWRASVGFSSRNSASLALTVCSTRPAHPRVPELRLRLALELRVAELDGDDGAEALADVVAVEVLLLLLEKPLVAGVAVQRSGQRRLEAREVRAALVRVDVVREGEDGLDVRGVPLHRHLDGALVALALEVDDVAVDGVLRLVHEGDEVPDPALGVELLGLLALALVDEDDVEALA